MDFGWESEIGEPSSNSSRIWCIHLCTNRLRYESICSPIYGLNSKTGFYSLSWQRFSRWGLDKITYFVWVAYSAAGGETVFSVVCVCGGGVRIHKRIHANAYSRIRSYIAGSSIICNRNPKFFGLPLRKLLQVYLNLSPTNKWYNGINLQILPLGIFSYYYLGAMCNRVHGWVAKTSCFLVNFPGRWFCDVIGLRSGSHSAAPLDNAGKRYHMLLKFGKRSGLMP